MTAKEMFEKLGYKKCDKSNKRVLGYKKIFMRNDYFIEFGIETKQFIIYRETFKLDEIIDEIRVCNFDEYKAITQQMKELGWLDEN